MRADIVALEQAYLLNRFGAFVPAGMMFALRDDVVPAGGASSLQPGAVQLRAGKRPRPLVLRVNEGDCLEIRLQNLLGTDWREGGGVPREDGGLLPTHTSDFAGAPPASGRVTTGPVSLDAPRTRSASFHVTGLEPMPVPPASCQNAASCGGDGVEVGQPASGSGGRSELAAPGEVVVTRWRASHEGTYFAYSAAATVGGEGDGGQIGLGLFAAVTVEPAGSAWYRSQVTQEDLRKAMSVAETGRHPYSSVNYEATDETSGHSAPILAMLDRENRIVHSDLNAIVVLPEQPGRPDSCPEGMFGNSCRRSFREFTVIFHDEVPARQAFPELEDENNPLSKIRDGMGINYGSSGMGSLVLSTPTQHATGVARDCWDCRAEEFFLSSWANGDPALILAYEGDIPSGARYPDDPSNVHHSYLNDPVRFRNLHAGPKETHVFHLHAHQWVMDSSDPDSSYLDSQTISPGATFSYDIEFGGSGNRNLTVGDSIFHCHLYPHFAQGMWELWRVHDTFEDGQHGPRFYEASKLPGPDNDPRWRNMPDAEIAAGTAAPAIVPIPGIALAPLPTAELPGYPFYIPGNPGHRAPQPVLDMDVIAAAGRDDAQNEPPEEAVVNGGLPRHVVKDGRIVQDDGVVQRAADRGGMAARVIAERVRQQDRAAFSTLAGEWSQLDLQLLPHTGVPSERNAMAFHEGELSTASLTPVDVTVPPHEAWWRPRRAYRTDNAATTSIQLPRTPEGQFYVNSQSRAPGAPFANPCPAGAPMREYRAAFIQTELVYNRHGWFDPQGRILVLEDDIHEIIDPERRTRLPEPLFFRANSGDCIVYRSTNLMPSALNADDFQIFTPTDTIGQHIHLVKFDVTSSDGSGNGWNYEDGTFSPEEVRERIFAYNRTPGATRRLVPREHPLFRPRGTIYEAAKRDPTYEPLLARGQCPAQAGQSDADYAKLLTRDHPFCGAQRTTQRWWVDPIVSQRSGRDNTLRTVFTHDHFGPSSHQQHGLYAGLVVEPANSLWLRPAEELTPDEVRLLAGPGGAPTLDLASREACLRRDEARAADEPDPIADPALRARCKLLGGSDLAVASAIRRDQPHLLAPVEPRRPLRLRDDGGPTATLARIIAPECIRDGNSNPLQPADGRIPRDGDPTSAECRPAGQSRREFALAIADFGIAYNAALEPINPEALGDSMMRDNTAVRFGRRHVAATPARPLAISSEDPGSQLVNYRHEPLALRISEATPDPLLGGWNYRQARLDARLLGPCLPGRPDCLGDMANAFSTRVQAARDLRLATTTQPVEVHRTTRDLLRGTPLEPEVDRLVAAVERWRRDFTCGLYPASLLPAWPRGDTAAVHASPCDPRIERREPWRVFGDPATPILTSYESEPIQIRLIQGAQEAQHVFTMNGVKWLSMPASPRSGYINAQAIGISEHFEADIIANPFGAPHVDYLYFGSSVDQLWDGLWGVLRSYSRPEQRPSLLPRSQAARTGLRETLRAAAQAPADPALAQRLRESGTTAARFDPRRFLAPMLPEPPLPLGTLSRPGPPQDVGTDRAREVCALPSQDHPVAYRTFDVSAVRVCDLHGDCGSPEPTGIEYSRRYGIQDRDALVYVLNEERRCAIDSPDALARGCGAVPQRRNADVLQSLRQDFAQGRSLEPLVLRAPAGACLQVTLRNHLPAELTDGPGTAPDGSPREIPEGIAYHNFLPMITDGFNVNQFRMSSSVGLSAPRVAQNPLLSDNSNVALNGTVLDEERGPQAFGQGSLVPPCHAGEARCGLETVAGARTFWWSATDHEHGNQPIELGALPLRSFGDPIKHPMHGLGGALVIGPEGSSVCSNDRFAQDRRRPGGGSWPGGVSAEICPRAGPRFTEHVLMLQDAVNATRGGFPVPNLSGAEEPDDYGVKALNYRTEPLWARRGGDPSVPFGERAEMDYSTVLSALRLPDGRCAAGIPLSDRPGARPCDPETPVLTARPGETVRLHFVHPGGHTRQQGLAVGGHVWNGYPWSEASGSRVYDATAPGRVWHGVHNSFGPMMGVTLQIRAGGPASLPMDYLIRTQASFLFDGGIWGLLRVGGEAVSPSPASSLGPAGLRE